MGFGNRIYKIYILFISFIFLNSCLDSKEKAIQITMNIIINKGETATFLMGTGMRADEMPVHEVTLTVPYSMSKYEITNYQFCEVMNWAIDKGYAHIQNGALLDSAGTYTYLQIENVGFGIQEGIVVENGYLVVGKVKLKTDNSEYSLINHPVHGVTWYGAVAFCNFLSEMENKPQVYNLNNWTCNWMNGGYRLPTEAEWIYAAKGKKDIRYAWGNELDDTYCNYGHNYVLSPIPSVTMPVGFYNGENKFGIETNDNSSLFGLYDMTGNLWEWCWDWYGREYYKNSALMDPKGPDNGDTREEYYGDTPTRVWRGGGFAASPSYLRIDRRWSSSPNEGASETGFRIAVTLK